MKCRKRTQDAEHIGGCCWGAAELRAARFLCRAEACSNMKIIHLASLCQDPNLPWFLSATVTGAREETESEQFPQAIRRKKTTIDRESLHKKKQKPIPTWTSHHQNCLILSLCNYESGCSCYTSDCSTSQTEQISSVGMVTKTKTAPGLT